MDLIDRDALLDKIRSAPDQCGRLFIAQLVSPLYSPSIDAVPVIRCKDCQYYNGRTESCERVSADPFEQASVDVMDFCSQAQKAK